MVCKLNVRRLTQNQHSCLAESENKFFYEKPAIDSCTGRHTVTAGAAYLPMQKREKITPSRSSELKAPVMVESWVCARRSSSANRSSD